MSGKKKNRNKIKRTGTGSQASTTVQVGKSEGTLPEDSVEISNGHSTTELDNSAELNVDLGKDVAEVSGNGETAVGLEVDATHVHTNSDPAAEPDHETGTSNSETEINGQTSEATPALEVEQDEKPARKSSNASASSHHSDVHQPAVEPVEDAETPVEDVPAQENGGSVHEESNDHSEAISSSNKDSASAEASDEPNGHDTTANGSNGVHEHSKEHSESISSSIRAALVAAAEDNDDDEEKPASKRTTPAASPRQPLESSEEANGHHEEVPVAGDGADAAVDSTADSTASTHAHTESEPETKETSRYTSHRAERSRTSETEEVAAAPSRPARQRPERRPISRVSSSSSSSSGSVNFEEHKRELSSDLDEKLPRSSYKPAEPFSYNTSISDDEDDDETRAATSRAVERRSQAKARATTERVEQDLLDARETIQGLKRRLQASEAETETARDETAAAHEQFESVKLELDLLKKKYGDAVSFREESESDAKKWRQRAEILQGELELVKFTESKLADTARSLAAARDELEDYKTQLDEASASVKASAHERESLVRAHQRELASVKRAQEVTQEEGAAAIKAERERATEAIQHVKSKLKAQIRELEIQLEDRREDDGESRTEKRRLEREVRRLEEKLEAESSSRAKESRSSESNKRQGELLKDRVNKLTADKLDLETLVLQERRKFDALNADYDRASTTIRQLQAQLEAATKSAAEVAAGEDDESLSKPRRSVAAATSSSD